MTHPRRTIVVRLHQGRHLCREAAGRIRGVCARRRATASETSRFMDYGPDWPPVPSSTPAPPRPMLLRRCLAVVLVYAVIWGLGSVLLELRLHRLHEVSGHAVTTYTTIDH
jgi:hypothetical protein